ncbi:putative Dol-P-Glc:Glc(2)Man(9)GlcNAc(2)-PP-Dol alpha-1,2-glucosyltransferase [Aplysia californica]|uniref:Dol-P-Glc:Glc(2)Man(9)GlcNAc(2)-PP-Dol alpha-1,2-glucosyltransferase n=1 Tax=Aplysia californica TaxID=6500 RepID=A0ABM0JM83_APLCA|nr:putative Dol-P-Glc:Glc(2)Man(9)GlcNAc(2)-PP-Dol alpha-1,2-glucosyltransferase [Aplysia californica]
MFAVFLVTSIILATSTILFSIFQSIQNDPYMDEVFHVPQGRHYCHHNFTHWDPMITTLPGLYLSSVVILSPLAWVKQVDLLSVCSTQNLRACNILFNLGNFLLLYQLSRRLQDRKDRHKKVQHLMNACVLTLFPVLYFFTWFYYTDPGSTFFTLLMYSLCLGQKHFLAALIGCIAIVFRQTNVIWVLFCVAIAKIEVLEQFLKSKKLVRENFHSLEDLHAFKLIVKAVFESPSTCLTVIKDIICKVFWYLCVLLAFAVFVYLNEGIVVGDRKHHQAVLNFPQVFYFLAASAVFSFVHLISPMKIKIFLCVVLKNPVKFLLFTSVMVYLVRTFTYEHKYTLSDNRHYTFYVWSYIYRRHDMVRYALIPGYIFCLYQFYSLTIHKGLLWRVTMIICLLAVLVPQALFEFRYYIVPFYIVRLNMRLPCSKLLFVELLFYVLINAFTVYMFVKRPFFWPNEASPQRFMW